MKDNEEIPLHPADVYIIAIVIDDCSKYHIPFADELATVKDFGTLQSALERLSTAVKRRRKIEMAARLLWLEPKKKQKGIE